MDNSFTSGLFGGIIGVLFSHPLDTLRVRVQSGNYNMNKLYSGIRPPLVGVGIEKLLVFGNFEQIKKLNLINNQLGNVFASGMLSGLISTIIITPTEFLKINKQLGYRYHMNLFNLYRGWTSTLIREIPGYGIYFATYEILKNNSYNFYGDTFVYGGLSGATAWSVIYPSDVVKTKMQTTTNTSIFTVIQRLYQAGGMQAFYRGFPLAISRAFILHAGVFTGYEWYSKYVYKGQPLFSITHTEYK